MDFLKLRNTCGRFCGTVTEYFKAHSNQNRENKDSSQRHGAPGPWKQKLTYKEACDKYVLG
jgi:hypothetical protein